ncbi:MAG: hypothetical protein KUG82_19890 [Pseudomonadales bacterium]|nr:hypothetical protein [Pseudomonadales bacterium]
MTTYVGLPLENEYLELSNAVIAKLQKGNAPSQSKDTVKASQILIVGVLQLLVTDLTEQVSMKPFVKKVIIQVGAIAQKTIYVMVDKVISKLSNDDLIPFVGHYKKMEIDHQGKKFIGFKLDNDLEALINSAFNNIHNNETQTAKEELTDALLQIIMISLELFLKVPMGLIKLGMISRKLVDLTAATLEKVVQPAIRKIVGNLDQEELESFEGFIVELVLRDDESIAKAQKLKQPVDLSSDS